MAGFALMAYHAGRQSFVPYLTELVAFGLGLWLALGLFYPIGQAIHLPPCEPTKIICVHLNYRSRVEEFQTKLGPAPTYFHKPISSLNAHGRPVVRPPRCRYLNYEGEIAIVIGTKTKNVSAEEAVAHILGYTIANDFGLHDFRDTDAGSMLRVKGSDTLCPLGPGVVDDWDFRGKRIRTLVNGDVRQDGTDVGLCGRLVRAILERQIRRHCDGQQDAEDDDDDQELDQGEALLRAEARLDASNHLRCVSFHGGG